MPRVKYSFDMLEGHGGARICPTEGKFPYRVGEATRSPFQGNGLPIGKGTQNFSVRELRQTMFGFSFKKYANVGFFL